MVRELRSVLPSTAIARRWAAVATVVMESQLLMAAVSRSKSRGCNHRRIIASEGRRSGVMSNARAVAAGTSAIHSAIAAYER
ncbi:hypothetical protein SAMN04489832_7293 [Micromonospora cremea]|uniref:Uncharacterized protein n=1 Tax=Micromonospora cremea TaxID=709881 RepID=A0A1N6BE31_9ACTN|nr:hypothetical protein SAMN04489832_7293 [Micromonospora cremea]